MTSFGVDEATANGSLVLKQTYLRYLDPYEKVHFHGEEDDTANDEWADAEVNKQTKIVNILREKTRQITSSCDLTNFLLQCLKGIVRNWRKLPKSCWFP